MDKRQSLVVGWILDLLLGCGNPDNRYRVRRVPSWMWILRQRTVQESISPAE
jgi:hypothetical protein